MKVKMRPGGIAGIPHQCQHLPLMHVIAYPYAQALRLQMRVKRKAALAHIKHDEIARSTIERERRGVGIKQAQINIEFRLGATARL